VKIGEQIYKLRTERKYSQAELAEYMGVTPQAISKWENDVNLPDLFLVPKLATLFNVSTDLILGVNEIDTAQLLVSKYIQKPTEKNYNDAKGILESILSEQKNIDIELMLVELEFRKSMEILKNTLEKCNNILENNSDNKKIENVIIQKIRIQAILNIEETNKYISIFNETKNVVDLNRVIVSLVENGQKERAVKIIKENINLYNGEDNCILESNLLDILFQLEKYEETYTIAESIINSTKGINLKFNAIWLLWRIYSIQENHYKTNEYKVKGIQMLNELKINEYQKTILKEYFEGKREDFQVCF